MNYCFIYLYWSLSDVINHKYLSHSPGCFQVPDYYEIIKKPMDLSTMMTKIDLHKYETVADFMEDIDRICSNALEYNPDRTPEGN